MIRHDHARGIIETRDFQPADLGHEIFRCDACQAKNRNFLYSAKGERYSLSSGIENIFLANAVIMDRKVRCTVLFIYGYQLCHASGRRVSSVFPLSEHRLVTLLLKKYSIVHGYRAT